MGSDVEARRGVMDSHQQHWDSRYAEAVTLAAERVTPFSLFAPFEDLFPTAGSALEIACGSGRGAVWLAMRGVTVVGVDFSAVAIDLARQYADLCGIGHRCRFEVHDLHDGLPPGPPVDLAVCHLFRHSEIDRQLVDRLLPGGVLATACLSEVGGSPGRFRATPGELLEAFGDLQVLEFGEADGHAWLIACKAGTET